MIGSETIHVTTGNFEILDSGTVISYGPEPVIFNLPQNLTIRFSFYNDNNQPIGGIQFRSLGNLDLELQLYNFNNDIGIGNIEPIYVGSIDGRLLYLNFRVYSLNGSTSRTIHYSWYLAKI